MAGIFSVGVLRSLNQPANGVFLNPALVNLAGYPNPSHFAQVFRRVVGVTPTEFRNAL
jgi:hypothetical protein